MTKKVVTKETLKLVILFALKFILRFTYLDLVRREEVNSLPIKTNKHENHGISIQSFSNPLTVQ